jgi:hypothetical protein
MDSTITNAAVATATPAIESREITLMKLFLRVEIK